MSVLNIKSARNIIPTVEPYLVTHRIFLSYSVTMTNNLKKGDPL